MASPKIEGLRYGNWDVMYPPEVDGIQLAYQGVGWTEDLLYQLAGNVDATVRKARKITSDAYEWLFIYFYGHGQNMAILLPRVSHDGQECERHIGVAGILNDEGLELLVQFGKALANYRDRVFAAQASPGG